MEFRRIGEYRPDYLEEIYEHQVLEFAKRFLKKFDNLLRTVKAQQPKRMAEYTANLEVRYRGIVRTDYLALKSVDISTLLAGLACLREFPELAGFYLNYHIRLLHLTGDKRWDSEKVGVTHRIFLRSALIPQYTNLQVLTETFPRDEAVRIFKHHIDDYIREGLADQEDRYQTLEEFYENVIQATPESSVWERVVGEVEDGKLVIRKECCYWDEALDDLVDRELKYLVCCYGDFENIRSSNKCFKMTMELTIARGDPYCDVIVHDTRITKDYAHPPKEFFDSISPDS